MANELREIITVKCTLPLIPLEKLLLDVKTLPSFLLLSETVLRFFYTVVATCISWIDSEHLHFVVILTLRESWKFQVARSGELGGEDTPQIVLCRIFVVVFDNPSERHLWKKISRTACGSCKNDKISVFKVIGANLKEINDNMFFYCNKYFQN